MAPGASSTRRADVRGRPCRPARPAPPLPTRRRSADRAWADRVARMSRGGSTAGDSSALATQETKTPGEARHRIAEPGPCSDPTRRVWKAPRAPADGAGDVLPARLGVDRDRRARRRRRAAASTRAEPVATHEREGGPASVARSPDPRVQGIATGGWRRHRRPTTESAQRATKRSLEAGPPPVETCAGPRRRNDPSHPGQARAPSHATVRAATAMPHCAVAAGRTRPPTRPFPSAIARPGERSRARPAAKARAADGASTPRRSSDPPAPRATVGHRAEGGDATPRHRPARARVPASQRRSARAPPTGQKPDPFAFARACRRLVR